MLRFVFLFFAVAGCAPGSWAQDQKNQKNYPQGYFRNPLDIPILLSGNFGEMRGNHYHMGLDIKTQGRENLKVYAAAEGYISRIGVNPGGFGRVLYIAHPNGYTTVYAHLNDFAPKIEEYVTREQYRLESWAVNLTPDKDMFPVKKGEFIAYSGNTGGSGGPHLHFEIRTTEGEINLNPLLFGLPVTDNVKPRLVRLSVYDRTKSTYDQDGKIFPLKVLANGKYTTTPATITVSSPLVSFAFTGYDSHNGSPNQNGVFRALLKQNNKTIIEFEMDSIHYNDTRYLNAHVDYRYRSKGQPFLQHLSELPGFGHKLYRKYDGEGVLDISDGKTHDVEIRVQDVHGNASLIKFKIRYDGTPVKPGTQKGKTFYPNMLDGFEAPECEFFIPEKGLYDSAKILYAQGAGEPGAVSATHFIGSDYIPLHEPMTVRIKADYRWDSAYREKTLIQWKSKNSSSVVKPEWMGEWASAKFRDFGSFRLVVDTIPPEIIPSGFTNGADLSKATRIVFSVRDNFGTYRNVRAEINGKWIRFTNDKFRYFIYKFDENCPRGENVLVIFAEDLAGNKVVREFKFKR